MVWNSLQSVQICLKNMAWNTPQSSRQFYNRRIHQSVGNVLRIVVQVEDPKTIHEATQVIHKTLALTMKACRCATNGTLGHYTSGALAFKRDMLMNIPLVSDIIALQEK